MAAEADSKETATSTAKGAKEARDVKIVLQSGRSRYLGYAGFCLVAGLLLLWKFGTIGQGLGAVLLGISLLQGWRAVRTFQHPPGTFHVHGKSVVVPSGLCTGKSVDLDLDDVEYAFFLRRAVPWTQAGPLLVIEARGKAYSFPRDWFASDSDQRRVKQALNQSPS